MKRLLLNRFAFFVTLAITLLAISCNTSKKRVAYNPAFNDYLSAYTSGTISKRSSIYVRFGDPIVTYKEVNKVAKDIKFKFEPSIEGKVVWEDTRTIAYIPDEVLPSNTVYYASLDLERIFEDIPDSLRNFQFQFKTKEQSIEVTTDGLQNIDEKELLWQRVDGTLTTADFEPSNNIEKILSAKIDGSKLKIKWQHFPEENRHTFSVDSIPRTNDREEMVLAWDGRSFGISQNDQIKYPIPALGDFQHIGTNSFNNPDQFIQLEFSDPIKRGQNLTGLIRVGDYDINTIIDGNMIKVYPVVRLIGQVDVVIEPGIQNILGHKLQEQSQIGVTFTEIEPEVRLVGSGVILPQSETLPFVFEAVNLSAVDVRVIKILESNIPQFLQVNRLDGSRELKRVGHVLKFKTIDLTQNRSLDLRNWNRHVLDLSSLIKTEPGAIYEVAIGFKRSYSLYTCNDSVQGTDTDDMLAVSDDWYQADEQIEADDSYWDYYYEEEDYSWRDRKDPCKNAYYHSGRMVKRNVLASSLGIISKRGSSGDMFFAVTDINTTEPIPGVEIEVYNYQQHLMRKVVTGSDGFAKIRTQKTPYLLVAKKGSERGYLRLDDGTSLSVSRFDVAGKKFTNGLKGFIYGERGVWRPGDSIFLNFILEDKIASLPPNHPVTFELSNPQGQIVRRITKSNHIDGIYSFYTNTDAEAPTGNYTGKVRVGGNTFTKTIKVETVVPNRLKLELDFGVPHLSNATKDKEADLKVRWLHGAIAKGLDADVSVTLEQSITKFNKYDDFIFDDPANKFYAESQVLFEGQLNDEGIAKIKANITANESAPGMLTANFKGKAFEPGGNFSTDRFSLPFHPYDTYVGVKTPKGDVARGMLLTDTNHIVKLVTLDVDGKPVSGKKLNVKLYKLSWKWWWDKSEDDVANYQGRFERTAISEGTAVTNNKGEADWTLRVNYPEWGRYIVRACDEEGGHCTGKIIYIDWPGWAGRGQKEKSAGANMLTFTSEKTNYQMGENITLNIPTGEGGRALVSIETGSKVLDAYWVDATKGMTKFTFKATAEMAPNIYAHITLLQPHAQTANDLPMRMYGVIPIKVEDPGTILNPVISMPDVLEPESNVTVKIKERDNKSMTYSIAVVDEGLLDLTRFRTPNPWSYFYQRQALDVKTWDLFDEVVGADPSKINSLLSIGGDGEGARADEGSKQDRFKPVVVVMGPFHLDGGQSKSHTFRMPNYVGSVKTMVVAGFDGAYGSADKATPVKKPLMTLATVPRVLGPGEDFTLPVTVFAMEDNIKNVKVTVEGNDLLEVKGDKTQNLSFSKQGEKLANFSMKVKKNIGTGTVKVTATSGNEKAVYHVDVKVRNPNPRVVDVYEEVVDAGKSWNKAYTPVGMTGTNAGFLEVSTIPPMNLAKRLQYLIRYPHGCIEQTTSSVFPQVYLDELLELDNKRKDEIDKNIRAGINRLQKFQTSDGGFAYWPGNYSSDEWGTNYGGNFLLEAQNAGYSVPKNLLNNWKKFQSKKARAWSGGSASSEQTQAYRLYLLALAKSPDLGAMNRLRLKKKLDPVATWYLAASYQMAVQPEVAQALVKGLTMEIPDYTQDSYTYGSGIRDKAIILQTLSIMGQRVKAAPMVQDISKRLAGNDYLNTQATAYCLVAMAKFVGSTGVSSGMDISFQLQDGGWIKVQHDAPLWQQHFDIKGTQGGSINIKNNGQSIVYARLIVEGIPEEGDHTDAANNLAINVKYMDMEGKSLDVASMEQGIDFMAEVELKHVGTRGAYKNLALTQIFPSGWEIHNTRMDGNSEVGEGMSIPDYQDFRDDRVNTYYSLDQGEVKRFRVLLNASYLGKFYLPTIYTEAMYDKSINARQHGQWVAVVKPAAL